MHLYPQDLCSSAEATINPKKKDNDTSKPAEDSKESPCKDFKKDAKDGKSKGSFRTGINWPIRSERPGSLPVPWNRATGTGRGAFANEIARVPNTLPEPKHKINEKYPIEDRGPAAWFLGVEIKHGSKRGYEIPKFHDFLRNSVWALLRPQGLRRPLP
ncbi:hypothetical protein AAE478_010044 [Parahypoxylon ruwenzoriense]